MQRAAELEAIPGIALSGEIVAENVSYEDFLVFPGEVHFEWFNGCVIKTARIDQRHDAVTGFFTILLSLYLEQSGGGRLLRFPIVMRTRADLPVRAPDIQVLLPEHLDLVEQYEVVGAADLVIEVVSPGSERRDRIEKFNEYERAGVPEYWILDHRHQETLFYQLDSDGHYQRINPDENGLYRSAVLRRLKFEVSLLWRENLPKGMEIVRMVEAMLTEDKL